MEQILFEHNNLIEKKQKEFEEKLKEFQNFVYFNQDISLIQKNKKEFIKKYYFLFFFKKIVKTKRYIHIPNQLNIKKIIIYIENLNLFLFKKQQEFRLLRENSGKNIFEIEKLIFQNNILKQKLIYFSNSNKNYFIEIFGNKNFTIFQIEKYLESEIKILIYNFEKYIKTNF